MNSKRPCVLSIAGFDPSGGAGLLADIKTFEAHKVLGMGVVSALTFQNDSTFKSVKWIDASEIIQQIEILTRNFHFEFIKIGMIENLDVLQKIIQQLTINNQQSIIILDPILKASAGFEIHNKIEKKNLTEICKKIFLITPNTDEIKTLMDETNEIKAAKELSQYCNVFLKGGHSKENKGRDFLFMKDKTYPFRPKKITEHSKHGSGCVLSSAIIANLAKGHPLQRACLKAKDYVTNFLISNKTLLGYHKI